MDATGWNYKQSKHLLNCRTVKRKARSAMSCIISWHCLISYPRVRPKSIKFTGHSQQQHNTKSKGKQESQNQKRILHIETYIWLNRIIPLWYYQPGPVLKTHSFFYQLLHNKYNIYENHEYDIITLDMNNII